MFSGVAIHALFIYLFYLSYLFVATHVRFYIKNCFSFSYAVHWKCTTIKKHLVKCKINFLHFITNECLHEFIRWVCCFLCFKVQEPDAAWKTSQAWSKLLSINGNSSEANSFLLDRLSWLSVIKKKNSSVKSTL